MLRDGIPLEGALRRLCQEMRRGKLRDELQSLEADLAKGTPMAEALKAAPVARTLQADDSGRRQKRRPARRADHAGGLFPAPEQSLDAAERLDGLSAHCSVRRIFAVVFFVLHPRHVSFGDNLAFLAGTSSRCHGGLRLAFGCRRSFSDWRCAGGIGRGLPFRRRAECCAGACRPSRKPAWRKSHRPCG